MEKPMSFYIVCQKKRNNPRMDIRICQKKCDLKDSCTEYLAYQRPTIQDNDLPLNSESRSIPMELA